MNDNIMIKIAIIKKKIKLYIHLKVIKKNNLFFLVDDKYLNNYIMIQFIQSIFFFFLF